jgi:hypothetical protein
MKVNWVAMCEVGSREKITKNKPKKNTMVSSVKKWTVMNPTNAKWNNVAYPVDKMANWCTNGCWFTMALVLERKWIGSDQKTMLKGELLIWKTKNRARMKLKTKVRCNSKIQFVSNRSKLVLRKLDLDPGLKWA